MTTTVSLRDIEAIARLESAKMQHFYIGVEHLFIALTKLDGGMTEDLFEQQGLSARYLRYATRELAGHGDDRRYWPGYRNTPRGEAVLQTAQRLINAGMQPDERALLLAILTEQDNIAVRAMQETGVDVAMLRNAVTTWAGPSNAQTPPIRIENDAKLSEDERAVLQLMFNKYESISIEKVFAEGFSGSTVMLIQPIHGDRRADALVVVKIAERHAILWEKKRYDSFVKDTLPPTTARIESDPTVPGRSPLAGLKYTFVRLRGEDSPVNLYEYASTHDAEAIAHFLREALYNGFRQAWWEQAVPYHFTAWQEYDHLLPPVLIVQAERSPAAVDDSDAENADPSARALRPLEDWTRGATVHPGERVTLENFTVQKVKRSAGVVQMAAGSLPEGINRASRVDVGGLDLAKLGYYRGELIKKIVGQVAQTRDDLLQAQVQALEPTFNLLGETLPYSSEADTVRLPNPLRAYNRVLDYRVSGTLSTIHGDLHTGNILIGPNEDAWLIDFEWTRDGHTLFDWAVLETSLLIDQVAPLVGAGWDQAWAAARLIDHLNRGTALSAPGSAPSKLIQAFRPIVEVRGIVSHLLAEPDKWSEYYVALALCTLRVIGWTNRPLTARRLAFLASALAMGALNADDRSPLHTVSDLTSDNSGSS